MCRHCPPSDPGELLIQMDIRIRFRREMTDADLARSFFREWDEWPAAKRLFYLQDIQRARRAAEIAEMEGEFTDL